MEFFRYAIQRFDVARGKENRPLSKWNTHSARAKSFPIDQSLYLLDAGTYRLRDAVIKTGVTLKVFYVEGKMNKDFLSESRRKLGCRSEGNIKKFPQPICFKRTRDHRGARYKPYI